MAPAIRYYLFLKIINHYKIHDIFPIVSAIEDMLLLRHMNKQRKVALSTVAIAAVVLVFGATPIIIAYVQSHEAQARFGGLVVLKRVISPISDAIIIAELIDGFCPRPMQNLKLKLLVNILKL